MKTKVHHCQKIVLGVCLLYIALLSGCASNSLVTPLQRAAANGELEEVENLVAKGAEVNLSTGNFGTPLSQAAMYGQTHVAKWLLDHGANVDVRTHDSRSTPLYDAALHGHLEIIRLLLTRGADPNVQNKDGFTPLHAAAERGHLMVVKELLAHGADVHAISKRGITPLNSAMYKAHEPNAITEALIEAGAVVSVVESLPGMTGGTYWAVAAFAEAQGDLAQAISLYETAADYFDKATIATKRVKQNALAQILAYSVLDAVEQQSFYPAMKGSVIHQQLYSQAVATKIASGMAFGPNNSTAITPSGPSRKFRRYAKDCRRQAALLRKMNIESR